MAISRGKSKKTRKKPLIHCHLINNFCHIMSTMTEREVLPLEGSDCLAYRSNLHVHRVDGDGRGGYCDFILRIK
jgi:hypothetical protein